MCRSVPQTPVRSTRIRTSSRPIPGTGTSCIHSPASARTLTSAFIGRSLPADRLPGAAPLPARAARLYRSVAGCLRGRILLAARRRQDTSEHDCDDPTGTRLQARAAKRTGRRAARWPLGGRVSLPAGRRGEPQADLHQAPAGVVPDRGEVTAPACGAARRPADRASLRPHLLRALAGDFFELAGDHRRRLLRSALAFTVSSSFTLR